MEVADAADLAEVAISLSFKGRTAGLSIDARTVSTDLIFEAASREFGLEGHALKLLVKGKSLPAGVAVRETALAKAKPPIKLMVLSSGSAAVAEVQSSRSDPTVRGFASEDAQAAQQAGEGGEELSEWRTPQHAEHRFCRFEPCTWQSFGTRPSESTPHAFEARKLMLKLAQDPAVVRIMAEREWRVGVLGEMDPIDDRLAEKMENGGKRLLGYNTNAGARIDIRLRTSDLRGFLPYPSLVDTLLHELTHNAVGPHDEHFWHLFCQLKADYLRALAALSASGVVLGGKSPLQLADAVGEARDVRAAVVAALERDRQLPASELQTTLLDAYLAATDGAALGAGKTIGEGGGARAQLSREELASLRLARLGSVDGQGQGRAQDGAAGGGGGGAAPGEEEDRAMRD